MTTYHKEGWTCPKCDRVYGPNWMECGKCNMRIEDHAESSDASSLVDGPAKPAADLDHDLAILSLMDSVIPIISIYKEWINSPRNSDSRDIEFMLRHQDEFEYITRSWDSLKRHHLVREEVQYDITGLENKDHPMILLIRAPYDNEIHECLACGQLWNVEDDPPDCYSSNRILVDLSGMDEGDFQDGQPMIDSRDHIHFFQKVVHAKHGEEGGIQVTTGEVIPADQLRVLAVPSAKPVTGTKIVPRRLPPLRMAPKKPAVKTKRKTK